jgi:hypothetical protein
MVTHVAETIQAGTTTNLDFSAAFPPVTTAGVSETINWSEVDTTTVPGDVSMLFTGNEPLTTIGPVIPITIANGPADVGRTFSIDVTITATVNGISVPTDFSLDYTIVAGNNATPTLPGIPSVPTNAQMIQVSPGVYRSGDYHRNPAASTNWMVDDRTPAAGDDTSYYQGSTESSLDTAVADTTTNGWAAMMNSLLQGAGQAADNIDAAFTAISKGSQLIVHWKQFITDLFENNVSNPMNQVSVNVNNESDAQLAQDGLQTSKSVGQRIIDWTGTVVQDFKDAGNQAASIAVKGLQLIQIGTEKVSEVFTESNSAAVELVSGGTEINAGTEANFIVGGGQVTTLSGCMAEPISSMRAPATTRSTLVRSGRPDRKSSSMAEAAMTQWFCRMPPAPT